MFPDWKLSSVEVEEEAYDELSSGNNAVLRGGSGGGGRDKKLGL